jgi:anti-sigma factor RsiW
MTCNAAAAAETHESPATDVADAEGGGMNDEMLACRQVVELVTDYLEGDLPDAVRADVERHLRACAPCVTYVEQMRLTAGSLRDVPVESIRPEVREELVSAFRSLLRPPAE